jgi:hypothetical protein
VEVGWKHGGKPLNIKTEEIIMNRKLEYYKRDDEYLTLDAEQMQILKDSIIKHLTFKKGINYRHSSYGLKHTFESLLGFYISNMDFKEAMYELGIMNAERHSNQNIYYPIAEKSFITLY